MNDQWFTVSTISQAMSISSTAVRKKAEKENWISRKRAKGKGNEYHINNLSPETIRVLLAEDLKETEGYKAAQQLMNELGKIEDKHRHQVDYQKTENLITFNALPQSQKDLAIARLEIIKASEQFLTPFMTCKKKKAGYQAFIQAFQNRQLPVDDSVYLNIKSISRASLYRWQKDYQTQGLMALARKSNPRRGDCTISAQPEFEQFCIALLVANPHFQNQPSKMREYAQVRANKLKADWQIPSHTSFRRWITKWISHNKGKFIFATDHSSYFGSERGLIHDHEPWVSAPNDMWELDSTPTDVMLNVNGKLTRYTIVACIDVFTKRVKMLLSPSSTSEAIALLMRKVILDWGLLNDNGLIRTDNGSDYVAKRTVAIFDHLGAKQSRAEPFSGWQKPFIERFFGTFQGSIVEILPTYIGHNVSDREKIEACHAFADRIGAGRKKRYEDALELAMTPAEFQEFMDDWLEHYYNHRSHGGNDGLSPLQKYMTCDYKPRYVSHERALDMLLNYVGEASVRRGGVQINKLIYRAPELQEDVWMRQRVHVFLDPTDVAKAYLYPLDNFETCVEAVNADLIGRDISPEAYSLKRRETEKTLRQFKRDMKRYSEEFGIDQLAAEAIAQAKASNNLTMMPKPGEEHDNAALSAFEKAGLKKDQKWTQAELDAIEQQRERRHQASQRSAEQQSRMLKNEREIAWDMADILINGGELDERQQKWFDTYLRTHTLTAPRIQKYIESGGKTRRLAK